MNNFEKLFCFSKWKNSINRKKFQIVGGSILRCLLKDSFDSINQDIDIFFYGEYSSFDTYYYQFFSEMSDYSPKEEFHDDYEDRIREMTLTFGDISVKFQFVLYNSRQNRNHFYQILDQDCCQIGFNGEKVLDSYSFIQSLNTGTMINYHLYPKNYLQEETLERIEKYQKRGFVLMTPKSWNKRNTDPEFDLSAYMDYGDSDDEIQGTNDKDDMSKDVSMDQKPFKENNDSMEMSQNGRELLLKQ